MTEAIETISSLSPLAAVVIIAGVAAMALTQAAKQPTMTKGRVQALSVGVSIVLGTLAYIVSGVAAVFPPTVVEAVSTGVVVVAGVALTSRAAYSLLGRAIPDGTEQARSGHVHVVFDSSGDPEQVARAVAAHGRRRADRVPDADA